MYTILWFGETFLVLATAIVGFVTLLWMVAEWLVAGWLVAEWLAAGFGMQATAESEVQATAESGVRATAESGVQATAESGVQATAESGVQATAESEVQATAESGVQATAESGVQATAESEVQATTESEVQATAESGVQATAESGIQATAEDLLNVRNLSSELTTITNWYQLGLNLNLQMHELDKIQQDHAHQGNDRQMLVMLGLWLRRTPNATWEDVVSALQKMGENRVAENVRQKHNRRASTSISNKEQSKVTVFARENRQVITAKFADFQTRVCIKLFKNKVDTEEFRLFVTNQFPPGDCIPPPPAKLPEIFMAITQHGLWNYFHYSPVVKIAEKFGANDPEIEGWVENYKKDVKAYSLVTTVEDYIDADLEIDDPPPAANCAQNDPRYNTPVEWKTNFIDHSLQYLTEVWKLFSPHYLVPDSPPTALLKRVHKGCLSITWLVRSDLIQVFKKKAKIDTDFFQQYQILKVTVGNEIIYEANAEKETPPSNTPQGIEEGREPCDRPRHETSGGYDCNFVKPPPSALQTECPICQLVLRDPYHTKCCGTNFCHLCIQRIKANCKFCPTCRKDNFEVYPDENLKHSLSQLDVSCTYNIDGCEWTGKLRELDRHMNNVIHSDSPLLRMERLGAVLLSAGSEVMSDNENLNPATYEKNSAVAGQQFTIGYNSGAQQSSVDIYASHLKSVYTRNKLPIYDKWPQVKSKNYINLTLIKKEDITKPEADQFTRATIHGNIDDIKKSKRAMDISQIAQLPDGSQPKCILVEGAPGVGKSTFAAKLCCKWGKGKLLQQYQLVVLLRLRDKSVRDAKNISDLFQYHDHQVQQAIVKEIQRTGGKWVLLLFEGYDELPKKLHSESSIFLNVITGRELPEATVLITSRPWASEFLHRECKENISQHIEILGFTKDNIQSYLESTIAYDPSLLGDLKKYISCYPHINSLMYNPLNSAIVVEVYRNSRKDETLVPKTMTELFFTLVRSLLLRHLLDHPVHGKKRWRVRSFNDLPQDVYQHLCELGRIAYEGILHDQQVIFSGLPEDFETLGLMQCATELYAGEGAAVSYNFLHLTVQEYLAAFHLSQQPVEKQIEHFREYQSVKWYKQQQHHLHMVLRFLCGVRKFIGYPSEMLNAVCVKRYHDISASFVHKVTFDTLHWLFEAQDNDVIANLLGLSIIQFIDFSEVTPFDCFVLGYCVSHSNCTWKISILGGHIGDEGVELLVRAAVEKETVHCRRGISEIDLSRNNIKSEGVKHLLGFPKQLIQKLKTLTLRGNELDSESCAILAEFIPHVPHLKKLNLSFNTNIGQGGAVPLITPLTAHNSLEELFLGNTGVGVKDCQALSELLSSSTSLKELIVGYNSLPSEAVELIISGLHHNSTLETLDMRNSSLSLQNTISLASVLRTNHTLVDLGLVQCNIDSDGACQLASALRTNNTLKKLDLGDNPIGVKGATAFAEMLLKNKSLKELYLLDNSIGEEGTQKLIDSLIHNTAVKKLYLPEKYELSITNSRVDSSRVCFRVTVYN